MVAKVKTFSFLGIGVVPIDVQVKISPGNTIFTIVGLPDKAVGESKERVRAAILSTGLPWPYEKITVNLAPADIQKEGSHFDLAIAIGIMIEIGVLQQDLVDNFFVLGELHLDGSIAPISGIISAMVGASRHHCGMICPKENGAEVVWAKSLEGVGIKNTDIVAASHLLSLVNHLKGEELISLPQVLVKITEENLEKSKDLSEVKGQKLAKRALEIASAGGHNLLLIGPPGAGKSMLASRLTGILPPLELFEILEINMIHSLSGRITDGRLITKRPYFDPHHSCSMPAMVGGGAKAKPGEISLAHNGVLFLDELAEFPRQVLDSLRQPMETGNISISRANSHITYPANFQLIAAMNPCRCGYLGDAVRQCKRAPLCGEEYRGKISGPLLDRIDIVINVSQISHEEIFSSNQSNEESSSDILSRVTKARELQKTRYDDEMELKNLPKINSKIEGKMIEKFCSLDSECQKILKNSVEKMHSSMRGVTKILRVARTIADLDNAENIQSDHLLEAISYRRKI